MRRSMEILTDDAPQTTTGNNNKSRTLILSINLSLTAAMNPIPTLDAILVRIIDAVGALAASNTVDAVRVLVATSTTGAVLALAATNTETLTYNTPTSTRAPASDVFQIPTISAKCRLAAIRVPLATTRTGHTRRTVIPTHALIANLKSATRGTTMITHDRNGNAPRIRTTTRATLLQRSSMRVAARAITTRVIPAIAMTTRPTSIRVDRSLSDASSGGNRAASAAAGTSTRCTVRTTSSTVLCLCLSNLR